MKAKKASDVLHHYLNAGLIFDGTFKEFIKPDTDMILCPIDLAPGKFTTIVPHLYDMDLTKPIARKNDFGFCYPIVELAKISDPDFNDNDITLKYKDGISGVAYTYESGLSVAFTYSTATRSFMIKNEEFGKMHVPFGALDCFEWLINNHFNVFNLPKSQYKLKSRP